MTKFTSINLLSLITGRTKKLNRKKIPNVPRSLEVCTNLKPLTKEEKEHLAKRDMERQREQELKTSSVKIRSRAISFECCCFKNRYKIQKRKVRENCG